MFEHLDINPINNFSGMPSRVPMKKYYLKYYTSTVGEIHLSKDESEIFSMDISDKSKFFDKIKKVYFNSEDTKKWILNRIRPESQVGFNKLLHQFNIDKSDDLYYWKLFKETKGMNIKDRVWLSENYLVDESDVPWNEVLLNKSKIKDLDDYPVNKLNIFKTKTSLNIDGACEKDLIRIGGNLAILKSSLQHNMYDCACEEIVYKLCKKLGVPCSTSGYICDDLCYSVIDENIDLIHACDLLDIDEHDVEQVYNKLCRLGVPLSTRASYLQMVLLDIITRQQDRNTTNFGFYRINGIVKMYRLYDNGLSLYAGSKYNNSYEFKYGFTDSDFVLDYCCRRFVELGNILPFNKISIDDIDEILEPHKDYISNKCGNYYKDLCYWIYYKYNEVINKIKTLQDNI